MLEIVVVHERIGMRHPEISANDVETAWRNAIAMTKRDCDPPDIYAATGSDTKGRMLELLGVELDDGSVLIYHAMKLSKKMRTELGLV